jgi:carbohydrate-binding DOMON domain-containing protein
MRCIAEAIRVRDSGGGPWNREVSVRARVGGVYIRGRREETEG